MGNRRFFNNFSLFLSGLGLIAIVGIVQFAVDLSAAIGNPIQLLSLMQ